MPRGQLTKDIMRMEVLKIKNQLDRDEFSWGGNPKEVAHRYLNKVLDKIEEYYR
jgi:hypothetical protein